MKFYKLLHIPTGLFYQPWKGKYGAKTNLSKRGKVYHLKPTVEHFSHGIHMVIDGTSRFVPLVRSEWKIVEYTLYTEEQIDEIRREGWMDGYRDGSMEAKSMRD